MAAALGPRAGAGAGAGAEEWRRLLRSVTRLQACARGFLLRRRLRSVREEFEAVVLELEGDLRQLRWTGRVLQRPRFGPEDGAGSAPGARPGSVPPAARPGSVPPGARPGSVPLGAQLGSGPPAARPGSVPPGAQLGSVPPGARPGSVPPGAQPGSVLPGARPGSVPPGAQPGSVPPGARPGSVPPGARPGSVSPGARAGSVPPGARAGSVPPGARAGSVPPGARPGSVSPGARPGSVSPAARPGSVPPAARPGSVSPGAQPGSVPPGARPGSVSPGARPGSVPPGAAEPRGRARPAQPSPGKLLDPGEAAEDNETIPKKTPEKPDPPGPERAGSCGNISPPTPLPSGATPNPPNLGSGAEKSPEKVGRALAGSQEWDSDSAASEWDSSDLGGSPEIPPELRGLSRSELQSHRSHLLMELLWIQQAIASRKNFLMLKRKLGIPDRSGSIPEFLDWCGEALELQHQS